jgi:hypothetical protein
MIKPSDNKAVLSTISPLVDEINTAVNMTSSDNEVRISKAALRFYN